MESATNPPKPQQLMQSCGSQLQDDIKSRVSGLKQHGAVEAWRWVTNRHASLHDSSRVISAQVLEILPESAQEPTRRGLELTRAFDKKEQIARKELWGFEDDLWRNRTGGTARNGTENFRNRSTPLATTRTF